MPGAAAPSAAASAPSAAASAGAAASPSPAPSAGGASSAAASSGAAGGSCARRFCQYLHFCTLYFCTGKASKLNRKLSRKLSTTPSGEGTSLHPSGQRRQSPLLLQRRQYLYFCTSKASKLSTVGPVIPVLVAVGGHGALFVPDRDARRERGVPPEGPREPAHLYIYLFLYLFPRF